MEFPIDNLLDPAECERWIREHFHPEGLKCPRCKASVVDSHVFRQTKRSRLTVYRCNQCGKTYNLYSRTVFQQRHLTPQQVVLLMRGFLKGEPSNILAAELKVDYITVLQLRRDVQDNAQLMQTDTPLPDQQTETDEMFQNAGEKRRQTL
jgi:transposase-like protein